MARKTVYLPDELLALLEESDLDLAQSLSREFQDYLRWRLRHARRDRWTTSGESVASIRMLEAGDIERVLTLWDEDADGWRLNEMAHRRVSDNLHRTIDHADAFCLVAEVAEKVVGFTTASISGHPVMPGRAGEIEEVTVDKDYRRQRIGSDLVRAAVSWLDAAGIRPIRCLFPSEDEQALKPFYRSLGFECDQQVANLWPE